MATRGDAASHTGEMPRAGAASGPAARGADEVLHAGVGPSARVGPVARGAGDAALGDVTTGPVARGAGVPACGGTGPGVAVGPATSGRVPAGEKGRSGPMGTSTFSIGDKKSKSLVDGVFDSAKGNDVSSNIT